MTVNYSDFEARDEAVSDTLVSATRSQQSSRGVTKRSGLRGGGRI